MNGRFPASLRRAAPTLALALALCPVAANAYTSDGSDGAFHPTVSTVLDSTKSIFDFTDIFIPAGVIVTFSGLSSAQPIEFLATGNINIDGALDAGANSLWIETPGNITFSGSLDASGSTLSLVASTIYFSGTMNDHSGSIAIGTGGGGGSSVTITTGGGTFTGSSGIITAGGSVTLGGSGIGTIASGGVVTGGGSGGGAITVTGGDINLTGGNITINTVAVPEPETYAMLMAGLGLLGVIARRRKT